jgi:FkbM family methyltransferase
MQDVPGVEESRDFGRRSNQLIARFMVKEHARYTRSSQKGILNRIVQFLLRSSKVLSSIGPSTDNASDEAGTRYRNETMNDRWIVEHVFPGLRGGYFLEAGAADGKDASSCYILEKELGWTGICIEPHSGFFKQLEVNRPNSICLNLCLSDRPGTVVFIEGDEESLSPYLSGIESNLLRFKHRGDEISKLGQRVTKEAESLLSVLKACSAPPIIDYAAFDVEGSELEVLRDFQFNQYSFRAVSMECDSKIWDEVTKLMQSNGYREVQNPFNADKPWERYWLFNATV